MKISKALLTLALLGALSSCLLEETAAKSPREMALSAFEEVCLGLMPGRTSITSIIQHAAEQGWPAASEGEEIDPPNRPLRGPHRSWRIDAGGETIILGIEILGDPAIAERILAGEQAGGAALLHCNVHFDDGSNQDIAGEISSLSIDGRRLGRQRGNGAGPGGWTTRLWSVGRDGLRVITFAFDPDGKGRFIEASAEVHD